MLATVTTPYMDTTAGQLCLRLGLPPQAACEVLEVVLPAGAMELRILGASHQVRVLAGEVAFSELVACGSEKDPELPSYAEVPLGGHTYRFRSEVTYHPPTRLAGIARRLRHRFGSHPHAIVGVFPGSPHALTAIATDARRDPSWRSWHLYPQTGEVVVTRAMLERH